MTARSYTDDEAFSKPAVRSAWDAVKSEVTMLALSGTIAASNVGLTVTHASMGHPVLATLWAGIGLLNTCYLVSRSARTIGILKSIPALKP